MTLTQEKQSVQPENKVRVMLARGRPTIHTIAKEPIWIEALVLNGIEGKRNGGGSLQSLERCADGFTKML